MQSISEFNKDFHFLLCVIDIYSKYGWIVPLKDNKGIIITNAFRKNLNESGHKLNKIWVDKGRILQQTNEIMVTRWYRNVFNI